MSDYPVPQRWKQSLFRRGKLLMGDLHAVLARVGARLTPKDAVYRRYLSNVSVDSPEFRAELASMEAYHKEEYSRLSRDELAAQWDRIVDRRFMGFYSTLFL